MEGAFFAGVCRGKKMQGRVGSPAKICARVCKSPVEVLLGVASSVKVISFVQEFARVCKFLQERIFLCRILKCAGGRECR